MAAGAAEAAEAAVAVVEVGSAQQFEEQLRLKTKYAGRRGGRRTRGRRAGGGGHGTWGRRGTSGAELVVQRRPLLGPRRWPLLGKRSAAARVHNGSALQRPACGAF